MIVVFAIVLALAITAIFTFAPFAKSDRWFATVTPLASIIGSGFLVCAPLLAKEFGAFAAPAMAVLLVTAYAVGGVMRFNILHVEPYLEKATRGDRIEWLARVAQVALALAYVISVTYYLKLLAAFALRTVAGDTSVIANLIVTGILCLLTTLAFTGGLRRVEHFAHATVTLKLGVIGGLLGALALHWLLNRNVAVHVPKGQINSQNLLVLLGLLIIVQGFETSRYLGPTYDAPTRVRTMRSAQWISSGIYLLFLLLLTPFLGRAAKTEGVAGILDVFELIGPALGILVLVGAVSSQLSAAIADSIGATGILVEVSQKRLSIPLAYIGIAVVAVAVVWVTDPFQVIALSSRAFALYYSMQCVLAFSVSRREGGGRGWKELGFLLLGVLCLVAALAGAPAE